MSGIVRRTALALGAGATAAALVGAASFALFTSAAAPQQDGFAAGTVILQDVSSGSPCTPDGLNLTNLEPGDSGTCTYNLKYSGSLNAWVTLQASVQTTSIAAYTPSGSQTQIGGDALLNDTDFCHGGSVNCPDSNGLALSVTDTLGNGAPLPALANTAYPNPSPLPAGACANTVGGGGFPGDFGSLPAGSGSGNVESGNLETCAGSSQAMLMDSLNPTGDCAATAGCANPAGSWPGGATDSVVLHWTLPLAAGNQYQGSSAVVTLQASAVQASNNAVCDGILPGGTYGSLAVTGLCRPTGPVTIHGDLMLTPGSVLDAVTPNDLSVTGNVLVGPGALLGLGCSPHIGCTTTTDDQVGGSILAQQPLGVVVHSAVIGGNISVAGGGGGAQCAGNGPVPLLLSGAPVPMSHGYTDFEDNTIGGGVSVVGLQSCYFGFFRNVVTGGVTLQNDVMGDPDGNEVATNTIGGNLACSGDSPGPQIGDSGGVQNTVAGTASGQCVPPLP